ncbi:uncharacterized protein LOC131892493 isoform X1 [Tigriopus californicus]|nr:uncharacterized protein LOC131892493 isoform X1 [Tigriopus californicus]XP_059098377.1 uncharacterized protein LOC131892493 isoform X1 [Tigriopus californicus]|eukprot:TCALIF_02521-PA protein Name:"Protein of unknown function" AED:0.55 eAED:0.55 QI:0/-1/0/1/-1/1/1/0/355
MHAIQGAMAVRRERQKRDTRRLSQLRRRDSLNDSQTTLVDDVQPPPKTETSLTAFHLGVVFILLGFLMVFSSMVPSSVVDADSSRLLGVGTTFIMVGLIMVMVNRIITQREEEELTRYVRHRLGRTRSGHALARDLESGHPPHPPAQKTRGKKSKSNSSSTNGHHKQQRQSKSPSKHHVPATTDRKLSGGKRGPSVDSIASISVQNGKLALVKVSTDLAPAPPEVTTQGVANLPPTPPSPPPIANQPLSSNLHDLTSNLNPPLAKSEETDRLLEATIPEEEPMELVASPPVMIRTKSGAVVMVPTCVRMTPPLSTPPLSPPVSSILKSGSNDSQPAEREDALLETSFPVKRTPLS